MTRHLVLLAGILVALNSARAVDPPSPVELRLREALRGTTTQLRSAQNDNTALQSEKAELQDKLKELDGRLKDAEARASEAQSTIAALRARADDQSRAADELKNALEKSQAQGKAAAALAKTNAEARSALEAQAAVLNRTVGEQKMKNAELYKLGREILLRYEKTGLGEFLGAREPFVGTTRVKLENYAQDFQDRLTEQKIKPSSP